MKPYHDVAAPSIDPGVQRRLKRLDDELFVTWSPWALDVLSGQPIVIKDVPCDPVTGIKPRNGRIHDPRFYLWLNVLGEVRFVQSFAQFGQREVLSLETQLSRFHRPRDIMRLKTEAFKRRQETMRAQHDAKLRDVIEENEPVIRDLLNRKNNPRRDGKIYSSSVGYRGGAGSVERDSRERGFVLPRDVSPEEK